MAFTAKTATLDDVAAITALMAASMGAFLPKFLSPAQAEASSELMGLDTTLIEDGGYILIFDGADLIGSGGWSRRGTLFGGDHTGGRSARPVDPSTEPARIRAMYTHPDWARRGVGRLIIEHCEAAARDAGFSRAVLVATAPGKPFYLACGYEVDEEIAQPTAAGVDVPLTVMSKAL